MRVSAYTIYVLACLMAVGAAALSAIVLIDTFQSQQRDSEDAQLKAGLGQTTAMQTMISNQMTRMRTITDTSSRQLIMLFNRLSDADLAQQNAVQSLNYTLFNTFAPQVRSPNSLNGVGFTLMYANETTGTLLDRTIWVYWDLYKSGQYTYVYAYSEPEDNLMHAYETLWPEFGRPQLGADLYSVNITAITMNVYQRDDFFDYALPWTAADGNSYWYFTHMRSFHTRGLWANVQTWDAGNSWLDMMHSVLTPTARMVAFDSQGYVMAATNEAELARVTQCQGAIVNGGIAANCINANARQHPIPEIRDVYIALYQPVWDDLLAGPLAPSKTELWLYGQRYMAITATLFARDHLRVTVVWYQPWATLPGNTPALTALICAMTLLSTFVLTLLGICGVLRPLMALGGAMRAVAHTLTEGDGEADVTLRPRPPSVFTEVEAIGRDFETIVVDFLGFSSTNARDNKHAPKDTAEPFAVVFTDIQASTGLWGKDPAEMSRCVQAHHELIRDLIHQHHLYEVKTVGDSFMVTTTSAAAALRFALDVQTTLYDFDWGWDGVDAFYRDTTLALVRTTQDYAKLWNGLRVRVGIHYGMGEVTYDEVSKGFDYYGPVVNTAARIESLAHGGQIVVSQAIMDALPTPMDPTLGIAVPLGTFPLRGVAQPPALVEVKPARLQARPYPPPRLEEAQEPLAKLEALSVSRSHSQGGPSPRSSMDAGPDAWGRLASWSSVFSRVSERHVAPKVAEEVARTHALARSGVLSQETVAQQLLALYHILEVVLKPLAAQQQSTVRKALAKGWGVSPPKSKVDVASGMHLVQRISETTKIFSFLTPPAHPAHPRQRLASVAEEV